MAFVSPARVGPRPHHKDHNIHERDLRVCKFDNNNYQIRLESPNVHYVYHDYTYMGGYPPLPRPRLQPSMRSVYNDLKYPPH